MLNKFFSAVVIIYIFFTSYIYSTWQPISMVSSEQMLARHEMSLQKRYAVPSVNSVFQDNILLTLAYLSGDVKKREQIDWNTVRQPREFEIVLQPGETFAFHDDTLPEYKTKQLITTNAHFNASEGFITDGFLYGDGVCHLASLMNWVAKDAGLQVTAKVNHDFMPIPEIPKEYGTAIYATGDSSEIGKMQNLYIVNKFSEPVHFIFSYKNSELTISVSKEE